MVQFGAYDSASGMKEDITCICEYSKYRDGQYLGCPNVCCRTIVQPHLPIKINCLLTLFITAKTDLACVNAVISVVYAVPRTTECS